MTRRAAPARTLLATRLGSPVAVADGVAIYPRSAWAGDDRPPVGELYPEQVRFLLVHHSAGPSEYTEDQAISEMQSIYSFHTGPDRGWPDVCYNFFIDRFGRVFEARTGSLDGPVLADATGGSQGFAQLVCLLGDFTDALPTPAAIDSLTQTLAWLARRHRLEIGPNAATTFTSRGSNRWAEGTEVVSNTIAGHRDMSQTACPGDAFYPYVTSTLRRDVAARVATMPPVPGGSDRTDSDDAASGTVPSAVTTAAPAPATPPPPSTVVATTPPSADAASVSVVDLSNADAGGRAGASDVALGGLVGTGLVGLTAGLGWIIKRRMDNDKSE